MAMVPAAMPTVSIRPLDDHGMDISVPEHLRDALAPAERCVHEWTTYCLEYPEATHLRIGNDLVSAIAIGIFTCRFENQLGLASIVPMADGQVIGPTLHVEVLASKLGGPDSSVAFLRTILTDLFASGHTLPFIVNAPTARWVRESYQPPHDLFVFHFFRHHVDTVVRAVQAILGAPHRVLSDIRLMVRPHEVRRIEHADILQMLQSGRAQSGSSPATPLQRLRPEFVAQRLPMESYDNPENRFVLSAALRMIEAIDRVTRAHWYLGKQVRDDDRISLARASHALTELTRDSRFADLNEVTQVPAQSRVLQRKDGYREVTLLWQQFQRARSPIFARLETAIDLRDVATMYELWVLFELVDRIAAISGIQPVISETVDAFGSPGWGWHARYAGHGVLHYNLSLPGYSGITLRPDFVWERETGAMIVFDAKFRLHKLSDLWTANGAVQQSEAKDDDLQKMHTYRDALPEVTASIVVYPGTQAMFRSTDGRVHLPDWPTLLHGAIDGVGAIPMRPIGQGNPTGESDK